MEHFFTILLLIIAGVSNALMDVSGENLFKRPWWNKSTGWRYKYKKQDSSLGPAFPLSTTVLVGFTDGWHLFQLIFHSSWQLIISINQDSIHPALSFIAVKIIFGVVFEIVYKNMKKWKHSK